MKAKIISYVVKCPKLNDMVYPEECGHCYYCRMVLAEGVKCLYESAQEGVENICIPDDPAARPKFGSYTIND